MNQGNEYQPKNDIDQMMQAFIRLKDAELTEVDLTVENKKSIVNNRLHETINIMADEFVIVSYTVVDPRSLHSIKQQVSANVIDKEKDLEDFKAKAADIIGLINSKRKPRKKK